MSSSEDDNEISAVSVIARAAGTGRGYVPAASRLPTYGSGVRKQEPVASAADSLRADRHAMSQARPKQMPRTSTQARASHASATPLIPREAARLRSSTIPVIARATAKKQPRRAREYGTPVRGAASRPHEHTVSGWPTPQPSARRASSFESPLARQSPNSHPPAARRSLGSALDRAAREPTFLPTSRNTGVAQDEEEQRIKVATALVKIAEDATSHSEDACTFFFDMRELGMHEREDMIQHIKPRRPGTGQNHVRLIVRYIKYAQACELAPWPVYDGTVFQAVKAMRGDNPGANTLKSVIRALRYIKTQIHVNVPEMIAAEKLAQAYLDSETLHTHRKQAEEWSDKLVAWLEHSLIEEGPIGDRMLCGRLRIMAGSSTRHDDQRHATANHFEVIFHPGLPVRLRGLLGYSWQTKTRPRWWVCSALGIKEENDDWLLVLLNIIGEHLARVTDVIDVGGLDIPVRFECNRDCVWQHVSRDRTGFVQGPAPPHATDLRHIRYLMRTARDPDDTTLLFKDKQVKDFELHGGKATFIGRGLLDAAAKGVDPGPGVLHQGGWQPEKHEAMPNGYLRMKMVAALDFTEKVILGIRSGAQPGKLMRATDLGLPLHPPTPGTLLGGGTDLGPDLGPIPELFPAPEHNPDRTPPAAAARQPATLPSPSKSKSSSGSHRPGSSTDAVSVISSAGNPMSISSADSAATEPMLDTGDKNVRLLVLSKAMTTFPQTPDDVESAAILFLMEEMQYEINKHADALSMHDGLPIVLYKGQARSCFDPGGRVKTLHISPEPGQSACGLSLAEGIFEGVESVRAATTLAPLCRAPSCWGHMHANVLAFQQLISS